MVKYKDLIWLRSLKSKQSFTLLAWSEIGQAEMKRNHDMYFVDLKSNSVLKSNKGHYFFWTIFSSILSFTFELPLSYNLCCRVSAIGVCKVSTYWINGQSYFLCNIFERTRNFCSVWVTHIPGGTYLLELLWASYSSWCHQISRA